MASFLVSLAPESGLIFPILGLQFRQRRQDFAVNKDYIRGFLIDSQDRVILAVNKDMYVRCFIIDSQDRVILQSMY